MNEVTEKVKQKYPEYQGVSDDKLTLTIGEKYPQYLDNTSFSNDFKRVSSGNYDTKLSESEEVQFQDWKKQNAPKDSGEDYDLRGAFKAGLKPAENGHWPDTFKKPNHPTFSVESIYAEKRPELAGYWEGDKFVPPRNPIKLSPYEQADLASMNAGAGKATTGMESGTEFLESTKGLPILTVPMAITGKVLGAVMEHVVEPIAHEITKDSFLIPPEEGESIIPEEIAPYAAEDQKGVLPAATRIVRGLTTPGNLLTLPVAIESKPVQAMFAAGAASAIPDSLEAFVTANTPEERKDAATKLGFDVAMTALIGKGVVKEQPNPAQIFGKQAGKLFGSEMESTPLPSIEPESIRGGKKNVLELKADEISALSPLTAEALKQTAKEVPSASEVTSPMEVVGETRTETSAPVETGQAAPVQEVSKAQEVETSSERAAKAKIAKHEKFMENPPPKEQIQITVNNLPKGMEEGSFVQVDQVIPGPRTAESNPFSGDADLLKKMGYDIPSKNEFLTLPNGQYTLPQALEMLKAKEAQPELVGMGGAVPGEFKASPNTPTSIKNAQVDVERAKRGLPQAMKPIRRTFGEVWDRAMALIDNDPSYQDRLLGELRDNPRALTDVEDAVLLHRQVDLQNEYGKATRDLAQAFDDGRMDDLAREKAKVEFFSNQLLDLYDIGKKVGTETGRGLAARRMLANEDFSLASLEMQKRAANGGRPLTDTERADLTKIADEYKAKTEALEKNLADKESKLADLEVKAALDRLEKEAKPKHSEYILGVAEKLVNTLDKRADAARARLKEKFARTSAGIDPTILADLAEIGASHLARIGLDFAKWSSKMVEEFGDNAKPYLQKAYEESQKLVESPLVDVPNRRSKAKVKEVVQAKAEAKDKFGDAIKRKIAAGEQNDITNLVQKLVRTFVELGVKKRDELVDAVHSELKRYLPDITRDETLHAIAGYGKYRQLSQDAISVEIRDLKGQLRQVAKLKDMEEGRAPKMSGVEYPIPSDEERWLIKQVEEAKKKGGYTVTDPATQLRSALQSIETRLTNQIADLEHEIATKQKIVKSKTTPPTSPEIEALKARRDTLKAERDELFGKKEMTDEQRVKLAIRAVEKSIAEYERRIKEGELKSPKKASKTPSTPELEAARARRDALKDQLDELRDLATPKKTPEEKASHTFKLRTKNRIADLEERLATKNFAKKESVKPKLDQEALKLKFDLEMIKRKWYEALIKDKMANRTIPQKILGAGAEVLNTSRALMTSFDLSAVLRQGGFIALAHPIRAAKAFPAMIQALMSKERQFKVDQEILQRENFPLYQQSKLHLSEHGQKLSQMEEAYMSRWAEEPVPEFVKKRFPKTSEVITKLNPVAASQRAYTTFLNKLRADSFDAMVKTLSQNKEVTPVEAKAIANFINVATGRGTLGAKENALVGLSAIFFAPRYVASRMQLLAGQPLYGGTLRTRTMIAGEYARYLTGLGLIYALAHMDGADIEQDPKSSDFGKIRYGNTRVDPMSGIQQEIALAARTIIGETKNLKGKITPIRGDVPFGISDVAGVTGKFLRTKLAPAPALYFDLTSGRNVVGQPVTPTSAALNVVTPLAMRDIYSAMQEQGVPRGTALGLLSLLGMGLQTYDEKK